MSKIAIGIIIGILVIGGGIYVLWTLGTSSKESTSRQEASMETVEGKSLKELLASKKSQRCTMSIQGIDSEAIIYLASGKMRADATATVNGETSVNHILVADEKMYVWKEGDTDGFFKHLDEAELTKVFADQNKVDVSEKIVSHCENWTPDQSIFTVPNSVTFTDLGAALEDMNAEATSSANMKIDTKSMCAMCDQTPAGTAREQCLAALGC